MPWNVIQKDNELFTLAVEVNEGWTWDCLVLWLLGRSQMYSDISSYRFCKALSHGKSHMMRNSLKKPKPLLGEREVGRKPTVSMKKNLRPAFSKFHTKLFILAIFLVNFCQNNQMQASGKLNNSLVSKRVGEKKITEMCFCSRLYTSIQCDLM